jgi:hypothetical protein
MYRDAFVFNLQPYAYAVLGEVERAFNLPTRKILFDAGQQL